MYLHWNSFTPISWKRGTLKSLISRAYMVCSNETLLEKELKHLKHVFHKINGYPWWVIDQVSTSFQENINKSKSSEYYPDTLEQPVEKMHSLILPYAGPKSNTIIKTMNNSLKRILPDNVKTRVTYTGQKLGTKFQNKDKNKRINTNTILFVTINVQNQLVMKITWGKLEEDLLKDQLIIALEINNRTYLDML